MGGGFAFVSTRCKETLERFAGHRIASLWGPVLTMVQTALFQFLVDPRPDLTAGKCLLTTFSPSVSIRSTRSLVGSVSVSTMLSLELV